MTQEKHTPGPWACHLANPETKCNCRYIWAEYGGMGSIATIGACESMDGPWGDDNGPPLEVAKANARLITAAPDMLDALRACAPFADENGMVNGVNILAAIAKATGEKT